MFRVTNINKILNMNYIIFSNEKKLLPSELKEYRSFQNNRFQMKKKEKKRCLRFNKKSSWKKMI
jgi:hypothetical protein